VKVNESAENELDIVWEKQNERAHLKADLKNLTFTINHTQNGIAKSMVH